MSNYFYIDMNTVETIGLAKTLETPIFWDIFPLDVGNGKAIGFSIYPDTSKVMQKQQKEISDTLALLKIDNPAVSEIANDVLLELHAQSKEDVYISYTGDNELLLYRKDNGEYRNLIIDEDGDVVYMHIPTDPRNSYNEFYPFMMVDAISLATKL